MPTTAATTNVLPVQVARYQLTAAALRLLSAEHSDESHTHYADTIGYYTGELGIAARNLTQALDAAPNEQHRAGTSNPPRFLTAAILAGATPGPRPEPPAPPPAQIAGAKIPAQSARAGRADFSQPG